MKTIKTYSYLLLLAVMLFTSCSKDSGIQDGSKPEISIILDKFQPDMNTADNIPLVCVIFSQVGLQTVDMYIVKNDIETHYKTVTEFYDKNQYSLKESPEWQEDMTGFRITVKDRAGSMVTELIPISVIKYKAPPVIKFEFDQILIDETSGSIDIPITRFEVESSSKIVKVEVSLFRKSTTESIMLTPSFVSDLTYKFEQEILYTDGDIALQVKATDTYGKIKIETLPIKYISIPAPQIAPSGSTTLDPIVANSGTTASPTFNVTSEIGVNSIMVYKIAKGVETELSSASKSYNSEKVINFKADLPAFEANCNAIKIVAIDRLGRSSSIEIPTIIDLRYKPNMRIGSQFYSKVADPQYPDAFCFLSVKDLKTYSLSEYYADISNVDMYFYIFAGATRLYQSTTNRSGEAWSGDPENGIPMLEQWKGRNNMKLKKYISGAWSFNFDNVTAEDLKTPAVQNYLNQGQVTADFANYVAGEVVFFQTVTTSSAPAKIGIMRIEQFSVLDMGMYNNTKGFYVMSFKVLY